MPAAPPRRSDAVASPCRGWSLHHPLVLLIIFSLVALTLLLWVFNLRESTQQVALDRLAGTASQAMAVNRLLCQAQGASQPAAGAATCQPVHDCADLPVLLQTGLPAGYSVQRKPLPNEGDSVSCVLQHGASGLHATFNGQSGG